MISVLMISKDPNLLQKDSQVCKRMLDYGKLFISLDIFLLKVGPIDKENFLKLSENVRIYPLNLSLKSILLIPFRIIKIIKSLSRKIDVVTAQDPFEAGIIGWLVSRKIRSKLHLQIHTDFLNANFWRESLKNKTRIWLAKFVLPKADGVRVVSKRIKTSFIREGIVLKKEPQVVPVFVDAKLMMKCIPKFDLHERYLHLNFIILMISRLAKEKNIKLAIEAVKLVVEKNTGVGLVIIGDGPEKNNLVKITTELKLSRNVFFESWTNDPCSYYKTADLFLITSNYEGYGMSIIEARACGLSVVSTDVGIARESGATIVGNNPADVASAILKFANAPKIKLDFFSPLTKEKYMEDFKQNIESCLS